MESLFAKCPKKDIKTFLGNGCCKVISRWKLKQLDVVHRNKHQGQIIQRTELTRHWKIHCVECVVKVEKLWSI